MKNKYFHLFVMIFILLNLITVVNVYAYTEEEYQKAVVESAYQYYYRGGALQYDSTILTYQADNYRKFNSYAGISSSGVLNRQALFSPEEATIQDPRLIVCSLFTLNAYSETFKYSNGDKYVFKSKETGKEIFDTGDLARLAENDFTNTVASKRNNITILIAKQTSNNNSHNYYNVRYYNETQNSVVNQDNKRDDKVAELILNNAKPGDLIVLDGHVTFYAGDDVMLHSAVSHVPSEYAKAAKEINSYGAAGSKYHLESKLDLVDNPSGVYNNDYNVGQDGTVFKANFTNYINKALGNGRPIYLLRPLKEIMKNSNISFSSNTLNRINIPKLSLRKEASVEKNESVNLGDEIKYTITLVNNSSNNYSGIVVKDEAPNCTTGNKLNKTVSVNAGESTTITYTVKVKNDNSCIGTTITSDKTTVNGIKLKSIKTKINPTIKKGNLSNVLATVNRLKNNNKEYDSTAAFVNDVYREMGYNIIDIKIAKTIFANLFTTSDQTVSSSNTRFLGTTLESAGTKKTLKFSKRSTIVANKPEYLPYWDLYVDSLYGGKYTASELENKLKHNRNVVYNRQSLMAGDLLYIYDYNSANDNVDKKGGFVVYSQGIYLYLGDGNFATIKDKKIYVYNDTSYNFSIYTPDRSKIVKMNCSSCSIVTRGDRLLSSIIGQDSYIVLRPSYSRKIDFIKPTKTVFYKDMETLDLTGGSINITYFDNTKETIALSNDRVKVSGFNNKTLGKQTITVNYLDYKYTYSVNVIEMVINSFNLSKIPTKTIYVQNSEKLDLTGGVLSVSYNDGRSETINLPNNNVTVSGFDNTKLGTQTIKLTYNKKTVSFPITIIEKQLSTIAIHKNPIKTEYLQNKEELNLTGGSIKAIYNDNSSSIIDLTSSDVSVTGFNNKNLGVNTLKISYKGKVTTLLLNIIESTEKKIESISIKKLPNKINYLQNKEELSLFGGIIILNHGDGSTKEIAMDSSSIIVSGFNNTKLGSQKIELDYLGKKTSFEINIILPFSERKVTNIAIDKMPTKTSYAQNQEKLDLSGGTLKISYNDGTNDIISMNSNNVIVSGFNNINVGKNKVKLTYLGFSLEFEVTIVAKNVMEIRVVEPPSKNSYTEDEKLDLSGGIIEVTYDDGTKETINMSTPNIELDENNQDGDIVINYSGKTASFSINRSNGNFITKYKYYIIAFIAVSIVGVGVIFIRKKIKENRNEFWKAKY